MNNRNCSSFSANFKFFYRSRKLFFLKYLYLVFENCLSTLNFILNLQRDIRCIRIILRIRGYLLSNLFLAIFEQTIVTLQVCLFHSQFFHLSSQKKNIINQIKYLKKQKKKLIRTHSHEQLQKNIIYLYL